VSTLIKRLLDSGGWEGFTMGLGDFEDCKLKNKKQVLEKAVKRRRCAFVRTEVTISILLALNL
jgi:hypothetical protein